LKNIVGVLQNLTS